MTPENESGSPKIADFWGKVLGLEAAEAENRLRSQGLNVIRSEYTSRRGVEGADSERVIRARAVGNNSIEIIVSRFKTKL
jgi:hypothetical protein